MNDCEKQFWLAEDTLIFWRFYWRKESFTLIMEEGSMHVKQKKIIYKKSKDSLPKVECFESRYCECAPSESLGILFDINGEAKCFSCKKPFGQKIPNGKVVADYTAWENKVRRDREFRMTFKTPIVTGEDFYCGDDIDHNERCAFQCNGCNG